MGKVSSGNTTGGVVVPNLSGNQGDLVARWGMLYSRLDSDAFVVTAEYDDVKDSGGGGLKIAGTGVDGGFNSSTRTLRQAKGYDNRNGGVEVPLVNCR